MIPLDSSPCDSSDESDNEAIQNKKRKLRQFLSRMEASKVAKRQELVKLKEKLLQEEKRALQANLQSRAIESARSKKIAGRLEAAEVAQYGKKLTVGLVPVRLARLETLLARTCGFRCESVSISTGWLRIRFSPRL